MTCASVRGSSGAKRRDFITEIAAGRARAMGESTAGAVMAWEGEVMTNEKEGGGIGEEDGEKVEGYMFSVKREKTTG